jgi:hypothetical protein
MAKKKSESAKPMESIESYLCRTQGIGIILAEDVVKKMRPEIRANIESLIADERPVNEVMSAFVPAPLPDPEPEELSTE